MQMTRPVTPPRTESPVTVGVVMVQTPQPLHLHPKSRALSCRLHDGIRSCPSDQTPSYDGVTYKAAFSLIELAIVLVILGLLVGGIMTGQSLIRAAELRSVTTEYNRYVAATQTFRDKYFALPGDMPNATAFWGRRNNNTDCVTNSSAAVATLGACDGNGDGRIVRGAGGNQAGEVFGFWQHLANARLIEGVYTGIAGPTDSFHALFGTNIPVSKLTGGAWYIYASYSTVVGDTQFFDGKYEFWLQFGGIANTDNAGPILTPEDAWNIDTKLDDGKPATGKILARWWDSCTDAAASSSLSSSYLLTASNLECVLMFNKPF